MRATTEGMRTRRCAVMGCEALVESAGDVCGRCSEEIAGLDQWHREHEAREISKELRRQDHAERLRVAGRLVWRAIWLPELLFVGACCVYVGWKLGEMFWGALGVR